MSGRSNFPFRWKAEAFHPVVFFCCCCRSYFRANSESEKSERGESSPAPLVVVAVVAVVAVVVDVVVVVVVVVVSFLRPHEYESWRADETKHETKKKT